jgi:hypothetical protein
MSVRVRHFKWKIPTNVFDSKIHNLKMLVEITNINAYKKSNEQIIQSLLHYQVLFLLVLHCWSKFIKSLVKYIIVKYYICRRQYPKSGITGNAGFRILPSTYRYCNF